MPSGLTLGGAFERQFPEPVIRVHPSGEVFGGVAIAEFVKREAAGPGNLQGSVDRGRVVGKKFLKEGRGQQVVLGVPAKAVVRLPEAALRNGWR